MTQPSIDGRGIAADRWIPDDEFLGELLPDHIALWELG